ncbi:MAG: trehalose-6-phosphate synthase [Archangiaceae bacterium]|nr:trehalose-6-phosphate synthase [Archangiaceae bacterium]
MPSALRFLVVLVIALGLLTLAAMGLVSRTTWGWYTKDLALRAQLAVNGSRRAITAHWEAGELAQLREVLADITRDERIMGTAACGSDGQLVVSTPDYPTSLSCGEVLSPLPLWTQVVAQPGGRVHLGAIPVAGARGALGSVVLVQDLAFLERRESQARGFLLFAFALLAASASVITIVAARFSWRGWSNELRKLLRGGSRRPELLPLMQDVRELVERLVVERESEGHGGWTPQRLKQTLSRYLHGERVVIVANREPYIHTKTEQGEIKVLHPASGLVTALEPVMRACGGTWIAHGSGSADREVADQHGRVRVPPGEGSYVVRRVWLTPEEEGGYYYGFSNEGLWPLCHVAHTRPTFRIDDWRHYREVNRRFSEAVVAEVDTPDPIVLIQDYHFALAPRLIRERLPKATLISFWHIPWPNAERFGMCPWRNELIEGMLGSSILGFHTQQHCNNFIDSVDRYIEARIDREERAVVHRHRSTQVRAYPISIDWPNRWAREAPSVAECRSTVWAELGLKPDALLGVGVDRLDYTKGVEERLLAVERLLERFPAFRGRFTFAQLAAPSRTAIERYHQLNESVEALAARINQRFGSGRYRPIALLRAHHEPPAVFKYYRAADLCYVSSLHDGMNLVSKEFVAARDDERGVLVLSSFTGAARELTEALIVNPYDLEEASGALAAGLSMSLEDQAHRLRAMRAYLSDFNVYRWAGRMLADAARLRARERLSGRLTTERLLGLEESA